MIYLEAVGGDGKYYVYTKNLRTNNLDVFDQNIGPILPNSLVVSNQYLFAYVCTIDFVKITFNTTLFENL